MKNKITLLLLTLVMLLSFGGCTREEVVEEPNTSETIEVVIESSIKSPLDMTKEELLALTPAEIKEMVETYLPNYRETYGIDADREMSDADWLELRDFIYYQIYGEIAPSDTMLPEDMQGEDPASQENVDPNWIYYAPTKEYLESLTIEEFGQYMNDMMAYMEMDSNGIDFTQLGEDELEQLRTEAIADLAVENTEDLPTVSSEETTEELSEETTE